MAATVASAQAAAVEEARRDLERRMALCSSPLPPHPSRGAPPKLDSEDSSAGGFSTEGLSDGGSVLPSPRSGLSPRAARHPSARRRDADADGGAAAATASKQRQLLQLQRRRKRELEKIVLYGTPAEAESARLELPHVQATLSRRVPASTRACAPLAARRSPLAARAVVRRAIQTKMCHVLILGWARRRLYTALQRGQEAAAIAERVEEGGADERPGAVPTLSPPPQRAAAAAVPTAC